MAPTFNTSLEGAASWLMQPTVPRTVIPRVIPMSKALRNPFIYTPNLSTLINYYFMPRYSLSFTLT